MAFAACAAGMPRLQVGENEAEDIPARAPGCLHLGPMEAAGIEPASGRASPRASTCVSHRLISPSESPVSGILVRPALWFRDPPRAREPLAHRYFHLSTNRQAHSLEVGCTRQPVPAESRQLCFPYLFYEPVGTSARSPGIILPVDPSSPPSLEPLSVNPCSKGNGQRARRRGRPAHPRCASRVSNPEPTD